MIRRTDGATGEFRIVVDESLLDPATGFLTGIKIDLEGDAALAEIVSARIRAELTVRAVVTPCRPGSLPRSTHKASRLVRTV